MAMRDRIERYHGPRLGAGYIRCDVCGEQFLSGLLRIERGYVVEGACHKCAGTSAKRRIGLPDLFPRLFPPRRVARKDGD